VIAPRAARVAALLLAFGGAAAAAGCNRGTFLEVRFKGDPPRPVEAIRVKLTLLPGPNSNPLQSIDTVPHADAGIPLPLTFPTSMVFQLNGDSGSLRVDAEALGVGDRAVVATATANTSVMHAKTWHVDINFNRNN